MANLSRTAFLAALALTVLCSKHGMAQVPDTAHAGMSASQHAAMHGDKSSKSDTAFAALQARGKMAMGVDQYASVHHFDLLPNGGIIALQMKDDDSLAIAQIRAHLKLIQHAFEAGDFSTPQFVHVREMPGTDVMARRRAQIKYAYNDLPRGAEVRITTSDPEALEAIGNFLAAQRGDHRVEH
jgi:hypothetical protein